MPNNFRKIHKNYQIMKFPFKHVLVKEIVENFSSQRISIVVSFVQSSNQDPMVSSVIAGSRVDGCKRFF